jgi:2-dehydro-3-deoxyglucarate aldolase
MRASDLKQAMAGRRLTFGTWLQFSDSFIAEMMVRHGGFDWAVVDMEHSAIGFEGQARLIQTIDLAGAVPLVRVGANDPFMIKRALDAGAAGIIVPQVNTAAEARAAVDAAYYPPFGTRGVGLFRAQDFGRDFDAYRRRNAEETIVIAQIEHHQAVANLDAILAVDGIDGFLVGPYDMSASLGKPGLFDDADVRAIFDRLETTLRDHPKPGGFHVVRADRQALANRIGQGARLMAYGMDTIFLSETLQAERTAMDGLRDKD